MNSKRTKNLMDSGRIFEFNLEEQRKAYTKRGIGEELHLDFGKWGCWFPFLVGNEMKTTVFPIKWLGLAVTLYICSWITRSFFGQVLIIEWCMPKHEIKKNKESCVG